ncbi:murein L,D-transpeptidase catalytic domain family protein [Edaphosphingomonas haloaromaticamans]|uniref:murein L,D-transpeptidase catalytic domain family protein n=1 Tax=Edaphosphingomonas haloaromaticamans TaxID=653954 RepID=UPI000A050C6D|nr:murein L,D-transpeptidase catalytic domain family protein [Sphingomonas haloaromaticamans]
MLQQTNGLAAPPGPTLPRPALLQGALSALDRHRATIKHRDVIGIVDFSQASRIPRFHIVDVMSGRSQSLLVAHGRGSDPDHSGWVERFSNSPGSAASSAGAYLVGSGYSGKHGRSQRLIGLDPENSNAEARAIVVHAASYVSDDIVRATGKLGRSLGCFAVAQADITQVLGRLGPGRMIYAAKI